jgi:hypothetical protein
VFCIGTCNACWCCVRSAGSEWTPCAGNPGAYAVIDISENKRSRNLQDLVAEGAVGSSSIRDQFIIRTEKFSRSTARRLSASLCWASTARTRPRPGMRLPLSRKLMGSHQVDEVTFPHCRSDVSGSTHCPDRRRRFGSSLEVSSLRGSAMTDRRGFRCCEIIGRIRMLKWAPLGTTVVALIQKRSVSKRVAAQSMQLRCVGFWLPYICTTDGKT